MFVARFTILSGLGAGTISGVCYLLLAQVGGQTKISDEWLVDLRTVCTVGAVVGLGAWRLATWMQQIVDRVKALEKKVDELPRRIDGKTKE